MDVRARRFRARDGIIALVVAVILVIVCAGPSIRDSGEEMDAGWQRDLVLAVGQPAGAIGDALPFAAWTSDATDWLSGEEELGGEGSFATAGGAAAGGAARPGAVGPEAFDPRALGEEPAALGPLQSLLVTGDSMAMPLDAVLARRLAGDDVATKRDARIGTGLSKTDLLDWGALSRKQAGAEPQAVVVFIGANEGFPIDGIECCGADWAAAYATRARAMMDAYRRDGAARVYWLQLPLPRDGKMREIARVVNQAIAVAAQPYRSQVRVIDLADLFTPGGRYRVGMEVDGRDTVVREPDGVHLTEAGAELAADAVQQALAEDFR